MLLQIYLAVGLEGDDFRLTLEMKAGEFNEAYITASESPLKEPPLTPPAEGNSMRLTSRLLSPPSAGGG